MSLRTTTATLPSPDTKPRRAAGQRPAAVVLLAVVVLLDQVTKAWSWRHVAGTMINPGSNKLAGRVVYDWYASPLTGGMLDLLGLVLLTAAVLVLVRRRRPVAVLVSTALCIGGWGSNQLDRLGLHSWTAPGSVRGAVDFIALGHSRYNLADVFIAAGTVLVVVSAACLGGRLVFDRLRPSREMPRLVRRRLRGTGGR